MKTCKKCRVEKPVSEFYIRSGVPRGTCKVCYNAYNKTYRKGYAEWADALKAAPCTDCGNIYHPCAMQWDHLPEFEKTHSVARLRVSNAPKARVLEEIAKCELVCANCHSIRTYTRLMDRIESGEIVPFTPKG